jgi:NitT/TauT family transport system substrate-binding protein
MRNLFKHFWVSVLISIFIFSQISVPAAQAQQASTPVNLKVVTFPFLSFAPLYIAQDEGFFEEQGLRVEFVKMSEAAAIPALVRGDIDVWGGLLNTNFLNAMSRGAKIKIVAEKGHFSSTGCVSGAMLARKALVESGEMHSLSQLKGRRIDVSRTSYQEYFMDKLLNMAGLTPDDVEIVDVRPPGSIGALKSGQIDLTVAAEPWITRIVRAGSAVIWIPVRRVFPELEHAFIEYGPNLLEKNPEVGKRFMIAYLKGVRQANQGKTPRNLEIITKNTRMDRELLQDVCWRKWHNDGRVETKSVLEFQDWAIEKGLLDRKIPEHRFWDPRYVEHANKVLGAPPK